MTTQLHQNERPMHTTPKAGSRVTLMARLASIAGLAAAMAVCFGGGAGFGPAAAPAGALAATVSDGDGPDTIIFRDGRTVKGTVVSETSTEVRFKGTLYGMAFETAYDKKDILRVVKGERVEGAEGATDTAAPARPAAVSATPPRVEVPAVGEGKLGYYWVDLEGTFGEQISQTPLRDAFEDARRNNADIVILMLNAEWRRDAFSPLPDDAANFDEIFRAEKLAEIFTQDIPRNWEKQPRVAIWIKQAMAGAALLPMVCRELYFSSDARMGGLGNLSFMFEGVGDDVVREKQRSLRLAHAEGWAITGGYDPRLVRAMARVEYVLSYRMRDGRAELFEGYPANADEFLLTDDGKDSNTDTLQQRVSGQGNDVLTLNASVAQVLGLSRMTVNTKDELLNAMGIERTGVHIPGRSTQLMRDWVNGLDNSKRRLRKLRDDFGDVQVQAPGDYNARSRARGQQRAILEEMRRILRGRFGEAITPRWMAQNEIPPEAQINIMLEQIRIQQMQDRK
ncbi:MAG: hypothetical protein KF859_08345 [Phycisphaeraceae bacterium]|nr:hypothetical protein [Phycisphaeraceae bacterium]